LAIGDVRRVWLSPESLLGGSKVTRLELIGKIFPDPGDHRILQLLADHAEVVSEAYAGQMLGPFRVRLP
jgi:hypothetical protein